MVGIVETSYSVRHIIYHIQIFTTSAPRNKGLKKFEIELGILHMELDIPWDQPVPEALWGKVEEYCVNDVIATEAVFKARKQDFVAREILAELSGLSVNHSTQAHTARIIFGNDKDFKDRFIYTDLSKIFPVTILMEKRAHIVVKLPVRVDMYMQRPVFTRMSPCWTWRVCIRRVSSYSSFWPIHIQILRPQDRSNGN